MPLLNKNLLIGVLCAVITSTILPNAQALDEVTSVLELAENTLASTYLVVSEADKNGANVSILLRELDNAVVFLDKAYLEYRIGNINRSIYFATASYNISSDTMIRAIQLKDLTASEYLERFWSAVVTSSISIGIIIVLSFILWRRFKKWYQIKHGDLFT